MRFCAGLLALLVSSHLKAEQPFRTSHSVEYAYVDQQLASRAPRVERPEHLNIATARSLFLLDRSQWNWLSEAGATLGDSGDSSFTALQANSRLNLIQAQNRTTLEASWLRTHGSDATQRPLEESIAEQGAPFTTTQISLSHSHQLNAIDSLAAQTGIARNLDSRNDLRTHSSSIAWTRQLSAMWAHTLGMEHSKLTGVSALRSTAWTLRDQNNFTMTQEWSSQVSLGIIQQQLADETQVSGLAGVAFSYTPFAEPVGSDAASPSLGPEPAARPDLDRLKNLRTKSQYRFGWQRSLDQRRVGDPQFMADQYFAQGLWVVDASQNLQIDLQRSRSVDRNVEGVGDRMADLAQVLYRWNHLLSGNSLGLLGTFGLGVIQERITQNNLRFDRQQLRVSYGVLF